jgi:F-type H+-transporting ATPase subunit delta
LSTDTLQAKRYSQAIFEIASENKELDKWQIDLQTLDALAKNIEFASVMENPKFSFEKKTVLLESQVKGISKLALNLALLLTNKGIFSLLSGIYDEYRLQLDVFRGVEKAEVTTAIQMEPAEISKLADQLGIISGKKVTLTLKVDPQIIGGIIVRVGGKIMDGSTRSQLAALRNELTGYGS